MAPGQAYIQPTVSVLQQCNPAELQAVLLYRPDLRPLAESDMLWERFLVPGDPRVARLHADYPYHDIYYCHPELRDTQYLDYDGQGAEHLKDTLSQEFEQACFGLKIYQAKLLRKIGRLIREQPRLLHLVGSGRLSVQALLHWSKRVGPQQALILFEAIVAADRITMTYALRELCYLGFSHVYGKTQALGYLIEELNLCPDAMFTQDNLRKFFRVCYSDTVTDRHLSEVRFLLLSIKVMVHALPSTSRHIPDILRTAMTDLKSAKMQVLELHAQSMISLLPNFE